MEEQDKYVYTSLGKQVLLDAISTLQRCVNTVHNYILNSKTAKTYGDE